MLQCKAKSKMRGKRMKQAGPLIRVSTSRQLEGTSPEKQREAETALENGQGFALAHRQCWIIAGSGSPTERRGFRQAQAAAALRPRTLCH